MCVSVMSEFRVAKKDIVAWKVVRVHYVNATDETEYRSLVAPWGRTPQSMSSQSVGTDIVYPIQGKMTFPSWGCYLYKNREDARFKKEVIVGWSNGRAILRVIIPKGTKYRVANSAGFPAILAKEIIVTGKVS